MNIINFNSNCNKKLLDMQFYFSVENIIDAIKITFPYYGMFIHLIF